MMPWRLPVHCTDALQMARQSLRASPRDFWADDLTQAATVALWRAEPACRALAYTVARRAMIDEMRRIEPWQRMGIPVAFVAWQSELDRIPDPVQADSRLPALQALARMESMAPGWPAALAESEDLRGAGARMGVSESRACQVRRWLQTCAT